jgi:Tfp pilus assembly protein PilF
LVAAVLGRPEDATRRDQLFRDALTALRQGLPPSHSVTADVLVAYGRFLCGEGRLAEGEALLREAHGTRRRTLGDGNVLTAETAAELGRCLAAAGPNAESRALLLAALPVTASYPWRAPLGPPLPAARSSR